MHDASKTLRGCLSQFGTLLFAALLGGCGGTDGVGYEEAVSAGTPTPSSAYPYDLPDGTTVCSDVRPVGEGVEYYNFGKINQKLVSDLEFASYAKAGGVTSVASCEAARQYQRLRLSYLNMLSEEERAGRLQSDRQSEDATDLTGATDASLDDDKHSVDKIAQGVTSSASFAVKLTIGGQTCSGVLVGAMWLLTAAHCFPDQGWQSVTVKSGATKIASGNLWVQFHPTWDGTFGEGDDLALVWSGGWASPGDTSAAWMRIFGRQVFTGSLMNIFGYGATDQAGSGLGTRRKNTSVITTDSSSVAMIGAQTQSGEGRPCTGDSGGPAISVSAPFHDYIDGIASFFNDTSGSGPNCPDVGEWFYYTQAGGGNTTNCVTGGRAGTASCWIQDTINQDQDTPVGCTRKSVVNSQNPAANFSFLECW